MTDVTDTTELPEDAQGAETEATTDAAATTDEFPELVAGTVKGELMAITLDELKAAPDAWHLMSHDEQDEVIGRIERRVTDAVSQVIRLISSRGFARIPAQLESVTVKNGLKVVAKVSSLDPSRHDLIDNTGHVLTLVLADLSDFTQSGHGHKADPDQSELRLQDKLDGIADSDASQPDADDDNDEDDDA